MEKIMEMTFGQIIGGSVGIVALLSLFIEFTPIKWNPISSLLRWIGDRTNKNLSTRIDGLEEQVKNVAKEQRNMDEKFEEQEAVNCRIRILRFSDELRRNVRHSQESFDQVISDLDKYESYCKRHPSFVNNKTMAAKSRIMASYEGCMEQNDFL